MECFCRKVTLPTRGTTYHGNIFYYQQMLAFSINISNFTDASALFPTNITHHFIIYSLHKMYTVIITSFSVGLSFTITSSLSSSSVSPLIRYFHSPVTL